MKIGLLEFLDKTGQHISSEIFEKYKDERKSPAEWEALFPF